jgi:uncharacterized phage-associated protein
MTSAAVTQALIAWANRQQPPLVLTPEDLGGLLYYAQGWSLILRQCELFADELVVGTQGPTTATLAAPATAIASLGPDECQFVEAVAKAYWQIPASELLARIRAERPWQLAITAASLGQPAELTVDALALAFATMSVPSELVDWSADDRQRQADAQRRLADRPPLDRERLRQRAVRPSAPVELRS